MDRQIVYPGQVLPETTLLQMTKDSMIGLGMALQAILGSSTLFDGLACTPTGPASLQVLVGPGSVYSFQNIDNTAFSSLGSDTAHQIVKQGISLDTTTLSCAAPSTTGYSINYLIQAEYQDTDGGSTVLPYYNASNPSVAYNGPANSGTSQNTVRKGQCIISVKAGTAAATGTQATPSPDAGYTGLWVVTVANGSTAITSGNIALAAGAPFISEKLTSKISIPTGDARYLQLGTGIRTKLTNNTTFYVSTTGNDTTGNGTSGSPWATRQKAYDTIKTTYDLNGFTITIQLVDGTYTDTFTPTGWMVGQFSPSQIIINGNSGTPSNVLINPSSGDGFSISNGGFLVQNLKIQCSAGSAFNAIQYANIVTGPGIVLGTCSGAHFLASAPAALIDIGNSYTVSGNAQNHWIVQAAGAAIYVGAGITITLTGMPAFSTAFANATLLGLIFIQTSVASFSGSATGTRYIVSLNGVIQTQASGSTYLPGSVSGTTATGGQYT